MQFDKYTQLKWYRKFERGFLFFHKTSNGKNPLNLITHINYLNTPTWSRYLTFQCRQITIYAVVFRFLKINHKYMYKLWIFDSIKISSRIENSPIRISAQFHVNISRFVRRLDEFNTFFRIGYAYIRQKWNTFKCLFCESSLFEFCGRK